MLTIPSKISGQISTTSGMDCYERCVDKKHFLNYPKEITYQYNSRGFRDREWPEDLSDVIWCVGDSFTVGIGQPVEETWPQLLEKKTGKRCLNLGEDGCSNDSIALRIQEIYKLYDPKLIIVMWSYFSRRRIDNKNVQFDRNNFGVKEDITNFIKNFKIIVDNVPTNLLHLLIPNALIDVDTRSRKISDYILGKFKNTLNDQQYEDILKSILTFPQLDRARDCHHFDIKTSEYVCDLIIQETKNFDF